MNDYTDTDIMRASSTVTTRDFTGKMQMLPMTDIADINTLRSNGLMGAQLKPGILNGGVVVFNGKMGLCGVCVKLVGERVQTRLLAPCPQIPEHETRIIMFNAARTMYSTYPIDANTVPIYTEEELGRDLI